MSEKVPQHSHCHICGKAIPLTETLCSEECKEKYQRIIKRRRLMVYFMYAMLAALVIVFIVYNNR